MAPPGSGSSAQGASITVWHGYTDVEAKAIAALAATWNKDNPKQQVNLVFDGGNDSALQKTTAAIAAGKYPDIAYEFGSSANALAQKKQTVDLTSTVHDPSWNWSDFYPGEQQAATVNGKIVGLPALVDNLALVYNKKLFDAANLAYPTSSWTWDDFRNAAKKLTDASDQAVRLGLRQRRLRGHRLALPRLALAGRRQPARQLRQGRGYDSPAGLKALTLLHDMAVTDKSVYLDTGNGNYLNLFNAGKVAMLWTGPWDLSSINDTVSYGTEVLPAPSGGTHASISGPDSWMVFNNGKARLTTAKAFLKWLLSPDIHLQWCIDTGDLPVRQSEVNLPKFGDYIGEVPRRTRRSSPT